MLYTNDSFDFPVFASIPGYTDYQSSVTCVWIDEKEENEAASALMTIFLVNSAAVSSTAAENCQS
ncbi:hypothetical protein [Candidatus Amarolinea dominans]|uniref:hypothetical protein n=1 Tax=Candidatus Amarolinea dominans TaxID=3140696 RepID=UPI003136748D|nr:hypothetical protein [Anaerolineae bacterium]